MILDECRYGIREQALEPPDDGLDDEQRAAVEELRDMDIERRIYERERTNE